MKIHHETHVLSNGLRVLLLDRPQLPVVSLTLLVRGGVVSEGEAETGLAHLTTALLPQGTLTRSAPELAEDVESLGASLGAHADYDFLTIGLSALSRDAGRGIEILADVVRNPAFRADELERKRNDALASLARRNDDPSYLVRKAYREQVYGMHPYARSVLGTEASVAGFTVDDVRRFYAASVVPGRTTLAVVGDLARSGAMEAVRESFQPWPGLPEPAPETVEVSHAPAGPLRQLQKDGVTQAALRIGGAGFGRSHPDNVPAMLLNYVVGGGGFASRLMKSLREEQGLTYGASSDFQTRALGGTFVCGCTTSLATMNRAAAEMVRVVDEVRDGGVTEEELDSAKRYFTGSLPLTLQTNGQLATHLLEMELYGLEDGFWMKEIEEMRETSLSRVNEVAGAYLDPSRFHVVALADFREHEIEDPRAKLPAR